MYATRSIYKHTNICVMEFIEYANATLECKYIYKYIRNIHYKIAQKQAFVHATTTKFRN